MRKTIIYILVLALLGAALYFIIQKNKENIFGNREASFGIKDTASIGRIFLAHTSGSTIKLERKENGWVLNDRHPVLQSSLKQLLVTLYRQTADFPVPEAQHNMVVKALAGNSIKVELYDRRGNKMKVFYVGEEAFNFSGTYMLMEGAKHPYVVNIPGWGGVLTSRYSTDFKDWKDRIVFNIPRSEVKTISVQYPEQPLNSFILRQENGNINIQLDSSLSNLGPLNRDRAYAYAGFFEKVFCEGFTNGYPGMDSLLSTLPVRCRIDVTGNNGYTQHVTVFWRPLNKRSKNLDAANPDVPGDYDADRYFAVFNNNQDTAVIQHLSFVRIFRPGYEFFQETDNRPREEIKPQVIPAIPE